MKCPKEGCDGDVTANYMSPKYVEFYVAEIGDDGSVETDEFYDIDLDGSDFQLYCTKLHHLYLDDFIEGWDSNVPVD